MQWNSAKSAMMKLGGKGSSTWKAVEKELELGLACSQDTRKGTHHPCKPLAYVRMAMVLLDELKYTRKQLRGCRQEASLSHLTILSEHSFY